MRENDSVTPGPPGTLDTDQVLVRSLRPEDIDAIVRIDQAVGGRPRRKYFEVKLEAALRDSGVRISLVAEVEGSVAGFLLGSVFYGEFGRPEPAATIDTIGVHPDYRGHKVGKALMRQMEMNMRGLGIEEIETQVDWNQWELLGFLEAMGFEPAPRLSLRRRLG